jgi:hypothetical protein
MLINFNLLTHVGRLRVKQGLFSATPEVNVVGMLEPVERNFHWLFGLAVLPQSGGVNVFDAERSRGKPTGLGLINKAKKRLNYDW